MTRRIAMVLGLVLLAGAAGCSSSSGNSQLSAIEADVGVLMQLIGTVIDTLDPFAPGPGPAAPAPTGIPVCEDVSESCEIGGMPVNCCSVDGSIEECPTAGEDIDVVFSMCIAEFTLNTTFTIEIDGTWTYSPGADWPTGTRTLTVMSDQNWSYVMDFNGTELVSVIATDLDDLTQADCTGNLVTGSASCTLVEQQPL